MAEQIEGVKALLRKLDKLDGPDMKRALRSSVRAAGRVVAKQAAANIPVGSEPHTTYKGVLVAPGFAKRSIKVVTTFNRQTGRLEASIGVRAQAYYAVQFVELEVGKSSSRGRPWLRPAFEQTENKQLAEFNKALGKAIAKIARAKK